MRTQSNTVKNDNVADVPQDRKTSREIIEKVRRGVALAHKENRIETSLFEDVSCALNWEEKQCELPERGMVRVLFDKISSIL